MNKEETIVNAVALVTGAAIGFGVGYYVQKRKYEKIFEAETREINMNRKEGVFATPEGAVRELIGDPASEVVIQEREMTRDEVSALLVEQGYAPLNGDDTFDPDALVQQAGIVVVDSTEGNVVQETVEPEESFVDGWDNLTGEDIVNSIWANGNAREEALVEATHNEDEENMPAPDANHPYIITVDQFMTDTTYDDNKVSLLYFEGDDQMVDERETLVNNVEELVGKKNLQHFGLGSRDRNALYIRNDKRGMDIEIIRDTRTYMEVIHGVKPADQRSSAPRKMREDDE